LVGGRKKNRDSPQRHKGHEGRKLTTEAQRHGEVMGRKMQATSAEVTEKRGLWFET
jgi:hypothetical protein